MRLIHNLDASTINWRGIVLVLLKIYTDLQEICSMWSILSEQFPETITKTILRSYTGNFLQICVDFQKYWNNAVSNDGFIIENMDLSHIDLAVLWSPNVVILKYLCKSRMIAPIQLALESHIPMAGFQMALGVLNIGITEVASVLVLGIEKVSFGLVMSLGTFAFIIPKSMQQKVYYLLDLLSLRPTFEK